MPASDPAPNRSRWMREGRTCMAARDWAGAIRAYGQGLLEQPLLGMHYAANLERARTHYRQERHTINQQAPPTPRWWWPPPNSAITPPAAPSRWRSSISTWVIR